MLSIGKPVATRLLAWLTAFLIIFTAVLPVNPASAQPNDLTSSEVTFHSGTLTLYGTVVAPSGDGTGRAGLVLVAGAGPRKRADYRSEAEAFARAGIVVLIYDKRTHYSRARSSFTELAGDATAGVELLRTRPDVDPSRVGLWGHSEGGWVAPLAASTSSHVGFVVTAGASGLTTDRTQVWSNRTYLSHAGVSKSLHAPIGENLSRMLIAADLFGDVSHDPAFTLERVRQPLLAVFGDHDRSTAPGDSVRIFQQALDRGGNTHYTLRVLKEADHDMRHSRDGFTDTRSGAFATGYVEMITSWIGSLAEGPPVAGADPPPVQDLPSASLRPPAWYESVWLQLTLLALMLIAFLAYPTGAVVRRLTGHREPTPVRWPARLLATGGVVTLLGTATYLFSIVATGATQVGSSLLGRPLAWLLLQLLAVGVVVATLVIALAWWRNGRPRGRLGVLLAGGVLFVPWALYWGLLSP